VLEPVNRFEGTGSVRVETEQWRATTDGDEEIPVGDEVVITEVRGTRLVVEPMSAGT
jgi:membrane protein implicated in regulation of membrane protease activity